MKKTTTKKAVKKTVKAKKPVKKAEISVFDGKKLVRTYTKEAHGAKFKQLAESFAAKSDFKVQ